MDIHRCRFVPYQPQAIAALAFSNDSNLNEKAPSSLRLALGRSDGDIEIWNPLGGRWVQESILRGKVGTTIEKVVWTQDVTQEEEGTSTIARAGPLRLFSSGGSPTIIEWDLARGVPKRRADGNYGDIWCLAAQPGYQVPPNGKVEEPVPAQLLAAGCMDGRIIIFTTEDDDLRYSHTIMAPSAKKSKPLSITWRDRNTVVAGFENGTIRVIGVKERKTIRIMTLGKPTDGEKSLVWCVKCLPDGTIVSGDAGGELKIWDSRTFSLLQRLKTHQADVLDVVSNAQGNMIFTVGVDRRTVAYKTLPVQRSNKAQRWTKVFHRRYHENNIQCAASYESKGMSVLVTGGVDCFPVVLPLRNWQHEYHRTLTHLPQKQQISVSPKARLLAVWWHKTIMLYHISMRNREGEVADSELLDPQDYRLVSSIILAEDEHIQSANLSFDGRLLAVATSTGAKMFQLRKTRKEGQLVVRTRPVELPAYFRNFGTRHVVFSPNGRWLCAVRLDNTVVLGKIVEPEDLKAQPNVSGSSVKLTPRSSLDDGALQTYSQNISCVAFSPDSRTLATGSLSGTLKMWLLEGHEDLNYIESKAAADSDDEASSSSSDSDSEDEDSIVIHGQKWSRYLQDSPFPRLHSAILTIAFRPQTAALSQSPLKTNIGLHATRHNPHPVAHEFPTTDIKLVAITATHNLVEFDVLSGKFSDWSRRNPSSQLPPDFTKLKDRIMGCFIDQKQRLFMYGSNWIYMLDLTRDLPSPGTVGRLGNHTVRPPFEQEETHDQRPPRKRKRDTGAGDTIKEADRDVGYGSLALKHKGDEAMKLVQLDDRMTPVSDDENDHLLDALVKLRRQEQGGEDGDGDTPMVNGNDAADSDDGEEGGVALDDETKHEKSKEKNEGTLAPPSQPRPPLREWHTTSYRSILGICPINEESEPLEVVLIERPIHDVDLPPRFDGGQDWDS